LLGCDTTFDSLPTAYTAAVPSPHLSHDGGRGGGRRVLDGLVGGECIRAAAELVGVAQALVRAAVVVERHEVREGLGAEALFQDRGKGIGVVCLSCQDAQILRTTHLMENADVMRWNREENRIGRTSKLYWVPNTSKVGSASVQRS